MVRISSRTRRLIQAAVREDVGQGDITSQALIPPGAVGEAYIEAKQSGTLCGAGVVSEVFRAVDPKTKVVIKARDGVPIRRRQKVFLIRGRVQSILKGERVALNFLGGLSGIATLTRKFVNQARGTRAKILDTRKTTPLWRELEKYAVRCGGGKNHRFGLWDEVLVKDNHWSAIRPMLVKTGCQYFGDRLRAQLRRRPVPVEIEVENLKQLRHLLGGRFVPNRVLLDNFSIRELRKAVQMVKRLSRRILLEASGGANLSNVRQIAKTGVHRISIGALTHSPAALDFSLTLTSIHQRRTNST